EAAAPPAAAPLIELRYSRFTLWYDCDRGEPHRFAYRLGKDLGTLARRDDFRPDRSLPVGCKGQYSGKAYNQGPGFHGGHPVPGERRDELPGAAPGSKPVTSTAPPPAEHNSQTGGRAAQLMAFIRDTPPLEVFAAVVDGDSAAYQANGFSVASHGIRTPDAV